MLRLGIIDFDTSHCVEFSKRLNHVNIDEELWVEGARIVLGWTGTSAITDPETIASNREALISEYGVQLVDRPDDMIGEVDGILIESQGGDVHYERTVPFLEAGIPCFVDKPFTCSLSQAKSLAELAMKNNVPLFSASSLRYSLEVQDMQARFDEYGAVTGADVYTPCELHPGNPGLYHYGMHGVENLYSIMGPGCRSIVNVVREGSEVVVGLWSDGRVGSVRGVRAGSYGFGFTAFCEKGIVSRSIDFKFLYGELLKRVIEMFETGKAPLDISETIEIIGFIEKANSNRDNPGIEISLDIE